MNLEEESLKVHGLQMESMISKRIQLSNAKVFKDTMKNHGLPKNIPN